MEILNIFEEIRIPATIVHVISVVLGMGAALVSDLLFSFFSKDKKLNTTEIKTLEILSKTVVYSLIVITVSGVAIFLSDIERYTNSAKFISKMTILAVLIVNGYILNKYIWPHILNPNFFTLKKERNIRKVAFVCGAISVVSWISVCTLGVASNLNMSYVSIISIYLVILVVSTVVSIFVEKKEFN